MTTFCTIFSYFRFSMLFTQVSSCLCLIATCEYMLTKRACGVSNCNLSIFGEILQTATGSMPLLLAICQCGYHQPYILHFCMILFESFPYLAQYFGTFRFSMFFNCVFDLVIKCLFLFQCRCLSICRQNDRMLYLSYYQHSVYDNVKGK